PLPPPDNAWTYYAEAVRVISTAGVTSPRQSNLEFPLYPPRGSEFEAMAAASEKANAAAFPPARRARRLKRLQFPQAGSNPNRGEWNDARNLAIMLADGAEYAHLRGDDAESVERLLDVLHLARSIR